MLVRPVPSPYNETQVRAYLVRIRFPGFIDNQVAASSSGEEREETRPEQLLPPLPPPTLETLAMVQRRHLCEVPFENTFIHYHPSAIASGPSLTPEALYQRIVVDRKGCFCFGQGSLLRDMLRGLGFRCYSGGARVNDRKEPISSSPNDDDDPNAIPVPSFNAQTSLTHVTVFVALPTDDEEAEQLYLVDVHFGKDTPTRPIPLRHGATVSGAAGPRSQEGHRLVRVQTGQAEQMSNVMEGTSTIAARVAGGEAAKVWCLVHRSAGEDGTWRALYSFNEEEMFAEDYRFLCFAVSHIPGGYFVEHLMVSRFFPLSEVAAGENIKEEDEEDAVLGRWTLLDWKLGIAVEWSSSPVPGSDLVLKEGDHEGRNKVLLERFGLDVNFP